MRVLLTGGSGTLGRRLCCAGSLAEHDVRSPSKSELDVVDAAQVDQWVATHRPELVIHAAAVIRARGVDTAQQKAHMSRVNVMGTAHVARAAEKIGARLIYVSTDFVFDGAKPGGMYREDDAPAPLGYYALTKLGGERVVAPSALVIRTSFGDDGVWPYPRAFVDRFTSKLSASRAAEEIAAAACSDLVGALHIGGARQSYFEFARRIRPDVEPLTIAEHVAVDPLPVDTSLDSGLWHSVRRRWLPDG